MNFINKIKRLFKKSKPSCTEEFPKKTPIIKNVVPKYSPLRGTTKSSVYLDNSTAILASIMDSDSRHTTNHTSNYTPSHDYSHHSSYDSSHSHSSFDSSSCDCSSSGCD